MSDRGYAPSSTQRNAVVVIAVIAAGAALYWLRFLLTPFALAVFLLIMIDGMARAIRRRAPGMPDWAATPAAMGAVVAFFGLSVFIVADNIAAFVGQLNGYLPRLNAMIADVYRLTGGEGAAPTLDQLAARVDPQRFLGLGASAVQGFAGDAILVLIYLAFLLVSRRGFERKIDSLFLGAADRDEAADIFNRIRTGVERYLWVQTVTALLIAGGCYAIMLAVGLDQALFWAFFIFLATYIPVVGPTSGTILPALFALVQFPGYGQAIVIFAGTQAVNFVVGNIINPRMAGQSLNLDPLALLLGLAFWSLLWGITGAFLATPLLVMAMVLLAQFDGTRWIAVLMSQNGKPLGEERGRRQGAQRLPAPSPDF